MLMKDKGRLTAGATALAAESKPSRPADSSTPVPASEVLKAMLDSLPPDHFTLVLALIAMVPGISYVAGLLLLAPAIEMIAGRSAPSFPGRIGNKPLPTRHLASAVRRAVPALRYLERVIRPRWQLPLAATKRLVGVAVFLLTLLLLLTPLPFIQVVPGMIIVILSVAYLEDDGLLLSLGLLTTLALAAASTGVVWWIIAGAKLIGL
jgi:hypothetical protein